MKCTVCNHPQRHDLDRALLAENATYAALSQQYGPSISALWRHKKHLKEKMRRAEKRLQDNLRQDYLFKFNTYLEAASDTVKTAGADGDSRLVLQAVREGTRILNFMTKLDAHLDQDTVYRLLASPQWAEQGSLLPTDPQFITDTHQALAHDLFFPCPEPPPDLDDDDDDEEEEETPGTSPLETPLPPGLSLELLQKIIPRLDQSKAEPPEREETRPKNQREKSAKLPRKISPIEHNVNEYQQDKICQKNTRKNSSPAPVGRASAAPPAGIISTTDRKREAPHSQTNKNRQTANGKRETVFERLETPQHESLFQRLRRRWAKTAVAPTENPNPEPETPKAWEPLNPFTHPKEFNYASTHGHRIENRPQYIPDRRWERGCCHKKQAQATQAAVDQHQ